MRARSLAHRAVMLLAVLWLAVALGLEVRAAFTFHVARPPGPRAGLPWRFGTPPVIRLQRFLRRATQGLPAEAPLAFASAPGEAGSPEFFRFLWASFLLPERDVVPSFDPDGMRHARFVVAYGTRLESPLLERIRDYGGGAVYRVRRREGTP